MSQLLNPQEPSEWTFPLISGAQLAPHNSYLYSPLQRIDQHLGKREHSGKWAAEERVRHDMEGCREYSLIPPRSRHLLPGPLMKSSKTPTRLQQCQRGGTSRGR